ncbi:DUF4265 domain-containing protein [Tenacibaculum agarivorans]|uniref:DUF4265 domain-containing protein n=1 Tax=Tenacibaculum agarivorans TaxID=1908389 RepID=UPI00094B9C11|nr:DUF4265 domain-containing protein [Tenacibaculum agarivorans]
MRKVLFNYKILDEIGVESLWATHIKENIYKVENIPFYVKEYAFNDLIKANLIDGILSVDSLYEESGNSTIRILINEEDLDLKEEIIDDLIKLGCDYEGSNIEGLISVNIPKIINYSTVENFLIKGELLDTFEYEEGCISTKHQKDS